MTAYNLISFLGLFFFIFIAWLFSHNKKNINFRLIFLGILLKLLFAFFIFYIPFFPVLFRWANDAVIKLFFFAQSGMYFVFGPLAIPPGTTGPGGEESIGFILICQSLPAIVFFSSLMAFLYYIGLMPKVIKLFSRIFTRLLKISGAESLCTASNIFVGIESYLTIKPYLAQMTVSELCTILTAGMATIASTVLAIYTSFLHKEIPGIAGHLIQASILSAPASIIISKIICPEDEKPLTLGQVVEPYYQKPSNWIESFINGSFDGLKLLFGIVALLLSFLGILGLVNWLIGIIGNSIGALCGLKLELSLERILGYIYYPFTFMMGTPIEDIKEVSFLLGERTIVTELVAYRHLSQFIKDGLIENPRSFLIASYALCGFSHIASLAIFVGGIVSLAPLRIREVSKIGIKALIAATLACFMTASVAGVFILKDHKGIITF